MGLQARGDGRGLQRGGGDTESQAGGGNQGLKRVSLLMRLGAWLL